MIPEAGVFSGALQVPRLCVNPEQPCVLSIHTSHGEGEVEDVVLVCAQNWEAQTQIF